MIRPGQTVEAEVVDGSERAEAFGQVLDGDGGWLHSCPLDGRAPSTVSSGRIFTVGN